MREGYTIEIRKADGSTIVKRVEGEGTVTLAPDVREYFPNSKAVNRALRTLISIAPQKRKAVASKAIRGKSGYKFTAKGRAKKPR